MEKNKLTLPGRAELTESREKALKSRVAEASLDLVINSDKVRKVEIEPTPSFASELRDVPEETIAQRRKELREAYIAFRRGER
jgi:ribosomal protein L29